MRAVRRVGDVSAVEFPLVGQRPLPHAETLKTTRLPVLTARLIGCVTPRARVLAGRHSRGLRSDRWRTQFAASFP